jgi:hypothetical protein
MTKGTAPALATTVIVAGEAGTPGFGGKPGENDGMAGDAREIFVVP